MIDPNLITAIESVRTAIGQQSVILAIIVLALIFFFFTISKSLD